MVKFIVTDLDGSLLSDDKELPDDFWKIEQELREKGIVFAVASGRPLHNIIDVFEPIKDHTYFISDNGSYVVYKNEELLVDTLDAEKMKEMVAISRTIEDVYPVLCGKHMAFMEDRDPELLNIALQYYQEYQIVKDLNKLKEPILKISMCDLQTAETNAYPYFKPFEESFQVAVSGDRWVDINGKNANKGNAVRFLQKKLGISADETMVFGDFMNDLQMMDTAKYSFAMKNAHLDLIKAAAYTTKWSNNEGGVTKTITELCL